MIYFFFQAEDGIRDRNVTGVQTCALPILFAHARAGLDRSGRRPLTDLARHQSRNRCAAPAIIASVSTAIAHSPATRSEERRVGKECRSRWEAENEEENNENTKERRRDKVK